MIGPSEVTVRTAPGNEVSTPVVRYDTYHKPTPGYGRGDCRQFDTVIVNAGLSIPTIWALGQVAVRDTGAIRKGHRVVGIGAVSSTAIDHLEQGNRQPIQATRNHNPGNVQSPNDPVPACTLKGVNFVDDIGQALKLSLMMSDFVTDSHTRSRSN